MESLRDATADQGGPPAADWRVHSLSDTLLLLHAEVMLTSQDGSETKFIVNCDARPSGDDLRAVLVFLAP